MPDAIQSPDRLWLTEKFDGIQRQLMTLVEKVTAIDSNQIRCRVHCDETSGRLNDDMEDAKRQIAMNMATQDLRLELERKFEERDQIRLSERIQDRQAYWIKLTALITGGVVISQLIQHMVDKWAK